MMCVLVGGSGFCIWQGGAAYGGMARELKQQNVSIWMFWPFVHHQKAHTGFAALSFCTWNKFEQALVEL